MIIQKLRTLTRVKLVRNIGVLVGGTAFSQLITILVLPILTRFYTPNDFGILAVYSSFLALISVISCLRFEIAISLPKNDKDAAALVILCIFSVFFVTLLTIIGLYLCSNLISSLTNGKLDEYIWWLPLGVFFSGIYMVFQYWAIRQKSFYLIARTRMTQSISGSFLQLIFGYLGLTPLGLLVGHIFNSGAGVFSLGAYFIRKHLYLIKEIDFKILKLMIIKYKRFPKYSTWEAFANSGSMQIPVILIAYYAISSEAGFLMLAMRLLSAPMSLIGGAIGQVYLAEASIKHHDGLLKDFTYKTVWALIKVGAPVLLLAGVLGPLLAPVVFGSEWQRVGTLIAWMVPWFLLRFVASPISMALHITDNQKKAMYFQFFGLMLRVGCVFISGVYFSEYIAEVYAITGFLFYQLYLIIILWTLRKY